MIYLVGFDGTADDQERISRDEAAKGARLIEVMNVSEGNFLAFSTDPNADIPKPMEEVIQAQQQQIDALTIAMAEMMGV